MQSRRDGFQRVDPLTAKVVARRLCNGNAPTNDLRRQTRMKFTLNTLGAPKWDLELTARNARAYGYAGVDLRLLDGEVITLESIRANQKRLRALFPANELPVTVLATSVRLATADQTV